MRSSFAAPGALLTRVVVQDFRGLGFWDSGFLGFRVLGVQNLRGLGFRNLGVWGFGVRI